MNLQNILMNMLRKLRDWHRRKIAIYHLSELETHRLRDIGIERQDIVAVVNGKHSAQSNQNVDQPDAHRRNEDRLIFGPAALNAN